MRDISAWHEQIEKIHKQDVDQINADQLHRFIDDQQARIDELEIACKKALEAMQWDIGGEPLPTLEIEAINDIKRVLGE